MRLALRRRWFVVILCSSVAAALLFAGATVVYAVHVRRSARAMLISAGQIRSTADFERQAVIWREQYGRDYWEDTLGDEHLYGVRLVTNRFYFIHLFPGTFLQVDARTRQGNLGVISATMYSGYNGEPGVSVDEVFWPSRPKHLSVDGQMTTTGWWRVGVTLPADVDESVRRLAFDNPGCFLNFCGCKRPEDMLPGLLALSIEADRARAAAKR